TKAERLASSKRFYSGTLDIDSYDFFQNIWNKAHETCILVSLRDYVCSVYTLQQNEPYGVHVRLCCKETPIFENLIVHVFFF
ncbi:hypothetical protein NDU88_003260, partial [Pleurodeles waltl]